MALLFTSLALLILFALNFFGCKRLSIYVVIGVILWLAVLKSGVHATLAGVALAMAIPDCDDDSLLSKIEYGLHPWIIFLILPLFAFVNAGVSFQYISWDLMGHPVFLGVFWACF